jgi:hypothetical protein
MGWAGRLKQKYVKALESETEFEFLRQLCSDSEA